MKKRLITIIILALAALPLAAQNQESDRVTVSLSEPGKPALVTVSLMRGSITVRGYEGQDVIIDARVREKKAVKEEADEGKEGLRLLRIASTGLVVEEESNKVLISTSYSQHTIDLVIQVPFKTSLKLGSQYHYGVDILVENVSGEMEVGTQRAKIIMTGISGSVVANASYGTINVVFDAVAPDKPMAFSTYSGDIDITLPADTKANLNLKAHRGNVYTDFEIQLKPVDVKKNVARGQDGKRRVVFERSVIGSINGGGPEYRFVTTSGDILIRKKK